MRCWSLSLPISLTCVVSASFLMASRTHYVGCISRADTVGCSLFGVDDVFVFVGSLVLPANPANELVTLAIRNALQQQIDQLGE
jgi:hypothetical protein